MCIDGSFATRGFKNYINETMKPNKSRVLLMLEMRKIRRIYIDVWNKLQLPDTYYVRNIFSMPKLSYAANLIASTIIFELSPT